MTDANRAVARAVQSDIYRAGLSGTRPVVPVDPAALERAARKAGLATGRKPPHAGPHVLRHTFCSHLAMRGAPVTAIQQLAGHRDLSTTMRYMHLSPQAVENAIALLEHRGTPGNFGDIVETGIGDRANANG